MLNESDFSSLKYLDCRIYFKDISNLNEFFAGMFINDYRISFSAFLIIMMEFACKKMNDNALNNKRSIYEEMQCVIQRHFTEISNHC